MAGNIYKHEGLRGFAKGINMTLINNMKLTIQFPMFYWLKEDKGYGAASSSFIAKLLANNIAYPQISLGHEYETVQRISIYYLWLRT